jgi:hypothetical protein
MGRSRGDLTIVAVTTGEIARRLDHRRATTGEIARRFDRRRVTTMEIARRFDRRHRDKREVRVSIAPLSR